MRFTICPECGNDKLKVKQMPTEDYDSATGRQATHGQSTEYHCEVCHWTALVDEPLLEWAEKA